METLDHDYTMHTRPGAGDDKLFVQFHMHFVHDQEASDKEGRAIFKDCPFIRIVTPGDRDNVIHRPVRPEDAHRFPRQWAAFKSGEDAIGQGTRVEEWPMISRAMAEELKFMQITTVEQVAEANEAAMSKMMGLRKLQERAKVWLEAAKGSAPTTQLQAQNEELQAEVSALREQVKELAKQVPAKGEPLPKADTKGK